MILRLRWLAVGAGFGSAMHVAAHLAADPGREWLQWIVNWGALWVIVPFLAGRRSDSPPAAALTGAVAGATQVAAYYGAVDLSVFQIAWLATGAFVSALVGILGLLSRRHRFGMFGAPIVLILEPIGLTAVFLALGRHVGTHWVESYSAELVVGVSVGILGFWRSARV